MELLINKEQITHIRARDYRKIGYTWAPEITIKYGYGLFKETYLEGYYMDDRPPSFFPRITKEELQAKKHLVDWGDGILMEKPFVKIFSGEKLLYCEHFSTYDNAKNYLNDHFNDCKYLKIIQDE